MIPSVEHLTSAAFVHRFGDLFAPPALTNFLGGVQAALDVTGIRSLNFPPFGNSDCFPPITWSDSLTGALFLDGRYVAAGGHPVTFTWRPDAIRRSASIDGLFLESETVLAVGRRACVVRLTVENRSGAARDVRVGFGVKAAVTSNLGNWDHAIAPAEGDNTAEADPSRGAVLFRARHSQAVSLQGIGPDADTVLDAHVGVARRLAAGGVLRVTFVDVIDATAEGARAVYDALLAAGDAVFTAARDEWNRELAAAFTPGNDRFSGSLPVLETDNAALQALYWNGALGALWFKREFAHAVLPRVYTTLMPRYWPTLTWLWDYELGSLAHALLDPQVMRAQLEHWMGWDVQTFMATDWLTGRGVGHWYAVNDHAMVKLVRDYVRWTGDRGWLEAAVPGPDGAPRRVLDAAVGYARAWHRRASGSGLADYGSMSNLLECLPAYAHEVAGPNALNVVGLAAAAELLRAAGRADETAALDAEAAAIVAALRPLYVEGAGYWCARHPDGTQVPVRHCVDALWMLNGMAGHLTSRQRDEIAGFVAAELQTPGWLHALSPQDPGSIHDMRPDHQWSGAFAAWPAEIASGLLGIGRDDLVAGWLEGIARAARQGPFGQAHFVESVVAPLQGGARKAPSDFPFLTDWACSAAAAWVRFVVEAAFGVAADAGGTLQAQPRLAAIDPRARLSNLRCGGRLWAVDAAGVHDCGAVPAPGAGRR